MTPASPAGDRPPDPDLVTLIASYDPTDAASAARTFAVLAPIIDRAAAVVSRGRTDWVREDFVSDAAGELLSFGSGGTTRIKQYNPSKGPLMTWLYQVLRNLWRSRNRVKANRTLGHSLDEELAGGKSPPPDWQAFESRLGSRFAAELPVLESWAARERVEVLCLAGLHGKVPDPLWTRYLDEYEAETGLSLVRPFPPPAFADLESPAARTRPLAAALGIEKPNTLSKRWERGCELLWELDFVAELLP